MNEWKNFKNLDPDLLEELEQLSEQEAQEAFHGELGFGTGGMRGIVGVGTNRLNIYTLRRANYGYAKFLLSRSENPSAVIGYDSRNKSLEFAKDSAAMLASLGVKVYLFSKITPTPQISFAVRHLNTSGGIVITASHNPHQYNGYKIYDDSGCQLVPDLVEEVVDQIKNAPHYFDIELNSYDELQASGMIEEVAASVDDEYLELVKSTRVYPNLKKLVKVVFTPLHGTGGYLAERLLQELGYEYQCVDEQMKADPMFSTVKLPNPEDPDAYKIALEYAKKMNADLVVATDPDADRLGVAVLDNNSYHFLTGNQLGAIFVYYLANQRYIPDATVINTIVTSNLGTKIAESKNLSVLQTLTGFKYIGEQIKKLEQNEKEYFFGYEESYGYNFNSYIRDKDAFQALVLIAEICSYYRQQNKSLLKVLDEIYKLYGYHLDETVNMTFAGIDGPKKIKNIIDYFRNNELDFKVKIKEDYLLSKREGGIPSKIPLPKENVLKFIFADESWFGLRPSGTEPKMKVYISAVANTQDQAKERLNQIKDKLLKIIESVDVNG